MSTKNTTNNFKNLILSTQKKLCKSLLISIGLVSTYTQATTVEFQTSQGNFEVSLYDESTPKTVTNFLNYVNDGSYTDTVFHRSVPNFIIQGGGFIFEGSTDLTKTATNAPVVNEPVWSNVKGTIAMAKLGGNADSATNQWFFNTENNSSNLDLQNDGFTVFGQVTGDGMDIINLIADQNLCNDVPMVNYDCTGLPSAENYITVYAITIVDSNINTVDGLTQTPNTLITKVDDNNDDSSGGGTFYWLILLSLFGLITRLTRSKK